MVKKCLLSFQGLGNLEQRTIRVSKVAPNIEVKSRTYLIGGK